MAHFHRNNQQEFEQALSSNFLFALSLQLTFTIGTISAILIMYKAIDPHDIRNLGFLPKLSDCARGIVLGMAMISIFVLIGISTSLFEIKYVGFSYALLQSVALFLLVAISEEFLNRGYILNNLLESVKPSLAITLSSLVFALLHIFNSGLTVTGLVNLALFGIIAALLFMKTNNISMSIGFHFAWNLCQSFFGLAVSGHKTQGIFEVTYLGGELLTGGLFGAEGSVIISALLIVGIVAIVLFYRKKDSNGQKQSEFLENATSISLD